MKTPSKKVLEQLYLDFDAIQQPKTPYVIKNMVVNNHFTPEQCWSHCVLEMQIAYDNLRLAKVSMSKKQLEIDTIKKKGKLTEMDKLDITEKEIELEQTERAVL